MSDMIKDLMNPDALPDPSKSVSLVQTHISLVLVADEYVYKIKKPVDFGFLDFSTLEKRKYYCEQEVKLNSRLSEGIYLEVLPIFYNREKHTMRDGGRDGAGEIVEYAVRMKRIPQELLMKSMFQRGELTEDHIKDIARVIARFHQRAERSPEIDEFGKAERFRINTDENFQQTEKYIGITIRKEDYDALMQWTDDFFEKNRDLFRSRVEAGKIRDFHGDLHMEHVCLSRPIAIIDCIEFSDRLRYGDTLVDIGFLLMDLEYNGGKAYSDMLWRYYSELTGDSGMEDLVTFFKAYRAYVRGKVNSFQLDDANIGPEEKEKATRTAKKYFELARSYID